jgi:hypothetical protein
VLEIGRDGREKPFPIAQLITEEGGLASQNTPLKLSLCLKQQKTIARNILIQGLIAPVPA